MFSGSILSTIEEAESDFLLLFDCCHAYHPPNRPSGSGRNVIEVISAVGFGNNAIAAMPGTDSFTHHLDEALALAKRRGPTKAVDLYMDIINRLLPGAPTRLSFQGSYVVDDHGPVEQQSRRQCPVHYWLSGAEKSITLAPVVKRTPELPEELNTPSQRTFVDDASSSSHSSRTPEELVGEGVVQLQCAEFPQVLVSFRVTREALDASTWVKWLLNAPPEARDLIKIEGVYGSYSTLIILRMPVQVWCLLPESRASSFLGFITTENYGLEFQRDVDFQLDDVLLQSEADQPLSHIKGQNSSEISGDQSPAIFPPLAGVSNSVARDEDNKNAQNDTESSVYAEGNNEGARWLACPFHKYDPVRYGVNPADKTTKKHHYRACAGPGFKSIQRLK